MARGKGRKNESTGKAKVNRQLGKATGEGRTGGGTREAAPEVDRARQMARRKREAEPLQTSVFPRGDSRMDEDE
jgi:hypothetical protein